MSELFGYDPVLVLSSILKRSASQVQTPHGFVGLVNPTRDGVMIEYGIGVGENYVGQQVGAFDGMAGYLLRTEKAHLVSNYQNWDEQFRGIQPKNRPMVGTVGGAPVIIDDTLVGVLVFIFEARELDSETDILAWLQQVSENASQALSRFESPMPSDSSSEMMPPPIPA